MWCFLPDRPVWSPRARVPRSAAPPAPTRGSRAAHNRLTEPNGPRYSHQLGFVSLLPFFFPLLSFSRQETNERSSSGPRAPAPLTRAPHPSRTRVWRDNATAAAAEKSHQHTPEIKVLDWFQDEPLHNRLLKHAKSTKWFFWEKHPFWKLYF